MRKAEDWRIQRAEAIKEQHQRAYRLALDIGVPIAMGSDCGAPSRFEDGFNDVWVKREGWAVGNQGRIAMFAGSLG